LSFDESAAGIARLPEHLLITPGSIPESQCSRAAICAIRRNRRASEDASDANESYDMGFLGS
jgi:hypothetical protein